MFEQYIANCDERVRRAFRLPPIFTGNAQDFSFATAFASYTVAEAQVFQPERDEFDEKINLLLMPELPGAEELQYKSLPLSVRDTTQQLEAVGLIADKITPQSLVETINQLTDLSLTLDEEKMEKEEQREAERQEIDDQFRRDEMNMRFGGQGNGTPGDTPAPGGPAASPRKSADGITTGLAVMAEDAAELLADGITAAGEHSAEYGKLKELIAGMGGDERKAFRAMLTLEMFPELVYDPAGAAELASCAFALVAQATGE